MRRARAWLLVWCATATVAGAADDAGFERQVAPILVRHCVGCHNASDPAGGLNLTERARALGGGDSGSPAIIPGEPAQSNLLARIRASEMPPEGNGLPVAADELAALDGWIQAGAPWPAERVLSTFEFTSATRAGRDWWSLAPPARPVAPAVRKAGRVRTSIDAFVLTGLEAQGLTLADDAPRATLIRRATLDLIGLPPTPEEIQQFVADPAPDAYERLVDRLLASPRYGERWARHWLDVGRFGESNGYETNTARPNAWPYRDWVIQAFNADMDYRRFIFEQLAGDRVGVDAATGFLVGGAHDTVGSPDVELTLAQRLNDLDDIVSTTAGAFLGLTIGCAKCHDHKFDPIAQRDYYALQAVFAGVEHGERELRTPEAERLKREEAVVREQFLAARRRVEDLWMRHQPLAHPADAARNESPRPAVRAAMNVDRFVPVSARMVRFTILATNQLEPCLDEFEVFATDEPGRNVALATAGAKASASSVYGDGGSSLHRLEHINDGQYGNARSWISAEQGGGWVQVEWPAPATIDRVAWGRDREGKFRDRLPTAYKIEVSTSGDSWQTVATADDRKSRDEHADKSDSDKGDFFSNDGLPAEVAEQLAALRREADALEEQLRKLAPPKVYAGTFTEPAATHLLYRGEPMQKRESVAPGGIAAVGAPLVLDATAPEAERRTALARWIGSPANPLTARTIANRIWHHHFGQGLVKTPSDLGWGGGPPSHPALLDWLAVELVDHGWKLKALHRTIMLSTVYRQASAANGHAAAIDVLGRSLWRFTPRRLDAESIRDAMLCTSGALDLRMGGPGYDVFETNTSYVKVYTPKQSFTPAEWRRMVYQNKPRLRQDATFGAFDCPDASQAMARRNSSTTALQALNLLNGPFVMQQAALLAERLAREAGSTTDEQVRRAFWLAFGRAPDDDELSAARQLVEQHGLVVFCRAVFNANEFLYLN